MKPDAEEQAENTQENDKQSATGENTGSLEFTSHAALEAQLAKVEAERDEYKSKHLLAYAEMENLRRRTEKDISRAHKFALEKMAEELLPIVDSLEQGLAIEAKGDELAQKIHEGMQLTLNMMQRVLDKFYIKAIDPKPGDIFNADLHEAMTMQPDPNAKSNTILHVLQKGYTLHDRLIRPALVVVAK